MKKLLITLIIYGFVCFTAIGQPQSNTDAIAVEWQLIENNYNAENAFVAQFSIVNKGSKPFDISQAVLYFSYPRKIRTVLSNNATFKNISGEFCSITFNKSNKAIAPNASLKIRYVAEGRSFKASDTPAGLYWVLNSDLNKVYPVKDFTRDYIPAKESAKLKLAPQEVYLKNQNTIALAKEQVPLILPSPDFYKLNAGVFILDANKTLQFDADFKNEANLLNQELKQLLGKSLPKVGSAKGIKLIKIEGLAKEAYQLEVKEQEIILSATHPSGMLYAIQSLKMLMPPTSWSKTQSKINIPCALVKDAPRFGYRSFMLDVARNFQTKQQIYKILDLLALYKMNTFHFHLNDDEGWRLEIPSLPELTELGSKRAHTLDDKLWLHPSYGSGGDSNSIGTGFYTKADFIEILKYAHARHIKVIPEIETPGHARAAIKSMDARYRRLMQEGKSAEAKQYLLRDTLDQSVYTSVQRYHDNVMNVALPSTYTFIEKVVDEVIEMYAAAGAELKTIHLGGDEVPAGVWEKSPAINQLMKDENIKEYDDLWYYYLAKANKILSAKGLYLSGWEEVAMRKTKLDGKSLYVANPDFNNKNFHTYVWNNVWGWGQEDLAYRLANAGYKVILAPVTNFYFDLAYEKDVDESGLYWGSYVDVDKPFYYNPFDHYKTAKEDPQGNAIDTAIFKNKIRLTDYGITNIVGLQCQIWSEVVRSPEQLEYMLLPKLIGFAERAWAKTPEWITETNPAKEETLYQKDWNTFVNQLGQRELPRLDAYSGGFNYRIPSVGAKLENGRVVANVQLPGLTIRYTTNGTEPNANSPIYTQPISTKGTISLKAFNNTGKSGRMVIVLN
jgi:hexosaminidase